jgi:hypothetical protein
MFASTGIAAAATDDAKLIVFRLLRACSHAPPLKTSNLPCLASQCVRFLLRLPVWLLL